MKGALVIIGIALMIPAVLIGALFMQERNIAHNTPGAGHSYAPIAPSAQAFILSPANVNYLPIRDFNIPDPVIDARAAIVYDVRSGRTLFAYNADEKLPIASITKLMTAMVIMDNLDLNSIYTVRAENLNVDGLGADLYKGEKFIGHDLLKFMLINSSNDAATVFASAVEQKGGDFMALMNKRARELGMYDTHFNDPAGLDDNETYSTINDVVKLVRAAGERPEIRNILTTQKGKVSSFDGSLVHNLRNTNMLLGVLSGIIIGKTGMSDGALGTLALEVEVNKGRDAIITVVLGSKYRFDESKRLIEWAKRAHRWE